MTRARISRRRVLGGTAATAACAGVRMFVSAREPTTIANLVDRIDHVAGLIGIEHVGIGTDSDLYGYDKMPGYGGIPRTGAMRG
jgi:membrane dipeptidase